MEFTRQNYSLAQLAAPALTAVGAWCGFPQPPIWFTQLAENEVFKYTMLYILLLPRKQMMNKKLHLLLGLFIWLMCISVLLTIILKKSLLRGADYQIATYISKNLQNMNTIDSSFENNIANIIRSLDIRVKKVDNECAFWALMDALVNDKSGFICNRNAILKAYIGGYLYTQQIFETKELFDNRLLYENVLYQLTLPDTLYVIPTIQFRDSNGNGILWVHTDLRNWGIGTRYVKELKLSYPKIVLPESKGFWDKVCSK